ncbi:Flp pilus assembly protein CpaB [Vibrio agarivorans]|uniref:Flp pilus assembly protein CpaB n=1 Tax=Vibrio agarivorans TaxID=153622 RepID=UPI0025B2F991|nr:Flp pilus assembly protein CpaB [Vibrio agarivorans]MDN3660952.1 Flp pilus assembly protein CpaB [Vibrio agarivorans]
MRTKILMVLAFIAISVGVYGVFNPPKQQDLSRIQNLVDDKPVFYRTYFLIEGTISGKLVSNKDYEIRHLSQQEAGKWGISSDVTLAIPHGSVYRDNLDSGRLITQSDILTPDEPGYIDAIIKPNHVPYAVKVNPETVVGGLIDSGTKIDVLAITQPSEGYGNTQISIEPILTGIKVLQVKKEQQNNAASKGATQSTNNHLILELTRKQVAQLTVAKKIAQIEVHKSIGDYSLNDLSANAGDVLPNFKAIKEFRANQVTVK